MDGIIRFLIFIAIFAGIALAIFLFISFGLVAFVVIGIAILLVKIFGIPIKSENIRIFRTNSSEEFANNSYSTEDKVPGVIDVAFEDVTEQKK